MLLTELKSVCGHLPDVVAEQPSFVLLSSDPQGPYEPLAPHEAFLLAARSNW